MARRRPLARWAIRVALLGLLLGLGWSGPAAAQGEPDPDSDPTLTFQWDDPKMRDGFKACMEVADWVARGRPGGQPHPTILKPFQDVPGGISVELWADAIDAGWFGRPQFQRFTYRPNCQVLLPENYETRISIRYYSEVFIRCQAVVGGDVDHERPKVVPAWYWFASLDIGECYLLLPLGAFGLGDDTNAWSEWSADDEVDYPDQHPNPAVMAEYRVCTDEYLDWRMEHGRAGWGGPGDVFDDPPRDAVPDRVWHEAIHFYKSSSGRGDPTEPAEWKPDCERLLLVNEECQPTGAANRSLLPEECLGPHPISHYDIGYSAYDDPEEKGDQSIPRHLWGGTTNFAFLLSTGGVRVALWSVDWAYEFDVSQYDPLATEIGGAYQNSLMAHPDLRLRHLFWLLLVGWAGFMSLRGKAGAAGSEILLTVVLLMISGVLLEQRETYMEATWQLMDKTSTALLVAGMGQDPSDDSLPNRDQLVDDLQREIQATFVDEPYDHLNWGQSLGDPNDTVGNPLHACAAARYAILSRGPHGGDKWPRQQMTEAGPECKPMVDFNRKPTGTRMLGAVLLMVSALVVAVLLVVVGLTVVVAKLIAVLLFAVLPFVVVFVILPAQGRRLWWSWATTVMQVVLAVVAMSFLLSLLLLTLNNLSGLTTEVDLIERFALMDIFVFIVWAARRNLLRSGQSFAARLSEYLSASRGSGTTWQQAATSAGSGLNLLNVDRTVGSAVGGPLNVATTGLILRMHERRAAQRGYRNLERVARWKRNINYRKSRRDLARRQADPLGTPRWWNYPLP